MNAELQEAQIHIRYDGESIDIPQRELDIGNLSTDAEIRQAVAGHLDVPVAKLRSFSIDRNPDTGSMTLRPQAVFG